ncbi:Protein of unknown function [Thermodesulforhabdus norvegica]|uniref:Peptidoglycan beta-N-acetylmuramidase NamZ C-terminal domain-containing protein n=1 Tax=Thermodesulforhabdus norvegica TaxID=39841 RepID=A0A1I4WD04_9BACT|nr:exo-beta-N-acetylmuramidase NamZ domain-containing protein [Thermodesulforhabdus norvegica]SFN11212.1 Protein of unknown function [Thermodesulforhabdus norvegica]
MIHRGHYKGTNISEGRGTTLPFQLFGAPFLNPYKLLKPFMAICDSSVTLRPVYFEPLADKWQGRRCGGFHIHVLNGKGFRPFRFGLSILRLLLELFPEEFEWIPPPYEYEFRRLPIDVILGSERVREALESGKSLEEIEGLWTDELNEYLERRDSCRLYT